MGTETSEATVSDSTTSSYSGDVTFTVSVNGSHIYTKTAPLGSSGSATYNLSDAQTGATILTQVSSQFGNASSTISADVDNPTISISYYSSISTRKNIHGVPDGYIYDAQLSASVPTVSLNASASGGGTVDVGGSTTVVIHISGGTLPYSVTLGYGGGFMVNESTDSSTVSWTFDTTSSVINTKAQNSSYDLQYEVTCSLGSDILSTTGYITVGTKALSLSISPASTTVTYTNTASPVTWGGTLGSTAETSGIVWYLVHSKGGAAYSTTEVDSSGGIDYSYAVTPSSSPVNDASTGTTAVYFHVVDAYGNTVNSETVYLKVFLAFNVESSGSASDVNIGSSNTITVDASGGSGDTYYYKIVDSSTAQTVAQSTTTATSFSWIFSSTSSVTDTIPNHTYVFSGTVTNGSSTLAIPDVTITTAKLAITASKSTSSALIEGQTGMNIDVSVSGTDESTVDYSIKYSVNSNALGNTTTWLNGGYSQTYALSSTSSPLNNKTIGTTYAEFVVESYGYYSTSNEISYYVIQPLAVKSSGSASNVNVASSNTIYVNATGGEGGYHYVLTYNGGTIAQSTTTSNTFTFVFDANSTPNTRTQNTSYTFTGTVTSGSSTLAIPDVTVSIAKILTTVSPSSLQKVFVDEVNAFNWTIKVTNTDESTTSYYINYSDIGSTLLTNSTTWKTDMGLSLTYLMSNNSIPLNDATKGTRYVEFYTVDQYSNYSTSAKVAYQTTTAYNSVLTVSGVGNVYASGTTYTTYYVSPLQSPVFLDYIKFVSTTSSIAVNLVSNWYSSTSFPFSVSGAGTHVIGTNIPLTLFPDISELQGYGIGNTIYFVSEVINNQDGDLVYSTTNYVGLYIVSPLSVSVTPSSVDITAGQTGTTTLHTTVSGGGNGSYNYQWYYDGSASVTSQNFTVPTYSSTATTRSHTAFVQVTSGNTFEVIVSPLITINVLGDVSVSLNGGNAVYGIVGNTYGFSSSVKGGKSPYTYKWKYYNGTSTTNLSAGGSVLNYVFSSPITSGNMTVTVTDSNGRSGSSTVGLFIYSPQNPTLSVSSTNILTGSTTLFTVSTSTTGSPSYTYVWYKNGSPVSGVISNTYQFSSNTAGSYTVNALVTSTKTKYAQFSNSITVNVHTPVEITVHPTLSTTKLGDTRTFSAYASYGLPPYVFSWFVGSSVSANGTTQSFNFSTTVAGTYTIKGKVEDNLGNSSTVSVTAYFTGNSLAVSSYPTLTTTYLGDFVNFSAYASGGISPYTYSWYKNSTKSTSTAVLVSSTQNYTFTPSKLGTTYFFAEVSDATSTVVKGGFLTVSVISTTTVNPYISTSYAPLTVNAYISSTVITTSSSPPTYNFTIIVDGIVVPAYNIRSFKTLDVAGEMTFTTIRKYVVPTSGNQVINVGSAVQFYFQNNLVWTGVVENILKKSDMEYEIDCFDNIYYLANLRVSYSNTTTAMNLGRLFANVLRFSQVNYKMAVLGSSYNVVFNTNDPVYYDLMKLATVNGYKSWLDTSGTLNITPFSTTNVIDLVENSNLEIIEKTNDVNYYFNRVEVDMSSAVGTTKFYASKGTTNTANATSTPKVIDLTFVQNFQPYFGNTIAKEALNLFPDGYRYAKTWYQFASGQNYDLLNVGIGALFSITFRDGTVWNNMILYEVEVNQTGVYLYFANFVKDVWSQLNSVTLLTS